MGRLKLVHEIGDGDEPDDERTFEKIDQSEATLILFEESLINAPVEEDFRADYSYSFLDD